MAPDLNSIGSNGKWDYSTPGSGGYCIPDIVYDDPSTRKLKVLTVGAGVSGINLAYQIQKHCQNVEHVIYEKNADLGGTWLENRYPGCACDIPSHAYTYNFALNPDWPRFFSYAPDIHKYLLKVVEVFGLRKYMTFNTEVVRAEWQEESGKWKVSLRQTASDGSTRDFDEECDLFLHATGVLNNFKMPNIPGLDTFKGRIVHTARWDEKYQKEEWAKDRVAIIGSGASSVQTVPTMQPHAKHMDIFVRTGVWFVQIANNFGQNHEYSEEDRDKFRHEPKELVAHAKDIENQVNGLWSMFYDNSETQKGAQELFKVRMAEFIKDERLLKGFTPKFGVGCRRVTPGDPYMKAIQEPNVDVHFTAVTQITPTSVIGADGTEKEVDTIVCATGFDVTYIPRFPVIGRNGVDLREKWKNAPESYLGLACPDMPNWITFIGPTWPVENGSVAGPLNSVVDYTLQIIKKMQREHIKSWVPKQDVTDAFNEHAQEWIKHTVWKDDCRSWYKSNETGRVNAVYPGSSLQYIEVISQPRYEDFSITYLHKNPWAHLGLGYAKSNLIEGADLSPYLQLENIDPKWLAAVGSKEAAQVVREVRHVKGKDEDDERGLEGGACGYKADKRDEADKVDSPVEGMERLGLKEEGDERGLEGGACGRRG